MEVKLKSNILAREEKGAFGVSVKRLMLAGGGAAATYMFTMSIGTWSILLALIVAGIVVFMTTERGGLPLWQRGVYGVRSRLTLNAFQQPEGTAARLCHWLGLPVRHVLIDGQRLFSPDATPALTELTEWGFSDGFRFVESPSAALRRGQ